jgi:opacity protein-like surface antigen
MKLRITGLLLILTSVVSFPGGTETIQLTGSKTISLNGLYFAGADGLIKTLNNPAGIIRLPGTGVEFSVLNRLAQNRFESDERGLFKSFRNDEILYGGGIFFSLSDNFKIALAYQPDINYNIEWPFAKNFSADTVNSLLVFDFFNRIKSDAVTLTAAFTSGMFSFGISPVYYRVTNEVAFPISNMNWPGQGSAGYQVEYNQDGSAFGFVAGIIADVTPALKLGLSVKSGYNTELEGTGRSRYFGEILSMPIEGDTKSTIEFPWIFGFGALYNFNPQWNFNIDARYSAWGSLTETIRYEFSNPGWPSRLEEQDPLTGVSGGNLNNRAQNSIDAGFGIEFLSSQTFNYRFGYRYSQSHNAEAGFTMLSPTVDQHWLSLGFGLIDENIMLDAVIAYGIGIRKNIDNNNTSTGGEYGYNAAIPSVSLRYLIR